MTRYLRLAALGDSLTVGVGDPVGGPGRWRGWSRLLAEALAASYDVSYCNLAVKGATSADLRAQQLPEALDHRADLVSLVIGVNDTLRPSWQPALTRAAIEATADALVAGGATLMVAAYPAVMLGLPRVAAGALHRRIATLNDIYRDVHSRHGGVLVDLSSGPLDRAHFTIDRLHPSELGHRTIAGSAAQALESVGYRCAPPALVRDGWPMSRVEEVRWMATDVVPWIGRRTRELGPWAAREVWRRSGRVPAQQMVEQTAQQTAEPLVPADPYSRST